MKVYLLSLIQFTRTNLENLINFQETALTKQRQKINERLYNKNENPFALTKTISQNLASRDEQLEQRTTRQQSKD